MNGTSSYIYIAYLTVDSPTATLFTVPTRSTSTHRNVQDEINRPVYPCSTWMASEAPKTRLNHALYCLLPCVNQSPTHLDRLQVASFRIDYVLVCDCTPQNSETLATSPQSGFLLCLLCALTPSVSYIFPLISLSLFFRLPVSRIIDLLMTTAISPSNSRGMGWRKPVPVFIPTPPVSRPTSDTIFTTTLVSAEGNESKSTAIGSPPPPVSQLLILSRELKARRPSFLLLKDA